MRLVHFNSNRVLYGLPGLGTVVLGNSHLEEATKRFGAMSTRGAAIAAGSFLPHYREACDGGQRCHAFTC